MPKPPRPSLTLPWIDGAVYSITSSAKNRNSRGITRPSSFAVFRLKTSSSFVGCSTEVTPKKRSSPAHPQGRRGGKTSGQRIDHSFARFQTNSSVSPDGVLGLVNLSSSAVIEVIIRFCSGPPIKFANVLPSTLAVTVLFASSTEYVP